MSLTLSEVEHIAILARLELTDAEKEKYRLQLSSILDYVAMLQELDTSEIAPTASVGAVNGELRPDTPGVVLPIADLLNVAPDTRNDQFRVPPVME